MIFAIPPVASAISAVMGAGVSPSGASAGLSGPGAEFSRMISDAVSGLHTAESTAISGIEGCTGVQQTVDAVMNAQTTFQAALSLRDKAVSAYQELARMAI